MRYFSINYLKNIFNICCIIVIFCLHRSGHDSRRLQQQVYIWQKKWPSSINQSIQQTAPYITGWRFLAGEYEPNGKTIYPSISLSLLTQTNLPIIAVYRFDRIRPLPTLNEIISLIEKSPAYSQYHIQYIELDLDWPTAKLPQYIELLKALKQKLPSTITINITMIPDWLHSRYLPTLTELVPEPVLQLHTVDNPTFGLFNTRLAKTYITKMNRISAHPFYIALPTYGMRVGMSKGGKIYYIEAENTLNVNKENGQELYSDPQRIRNFIEELEINTPSKLKGILWFRLPVTNDQRNWSLETWLAMIKHDSLTPPHLSIETHPDPDHPNNLQISLINHGNIPAPLPKVIPLKCHVADGFYPYQLNINQQGEYELHLTKQLAPLNTERKLVVGWMRCEK